MAKGGRKKKRAAATKRKPTKASTKRKAPTKKKPKPSAPSEKTLRARAQRLKRERALAKRRKAYRRRKLERESIAEGERERRREERAANERRREGDERQLLIDVLDDMRNRGSQIMPLSLEITEAEVGAEDRTRLPWLVVGRFDILENAGYAELSEVFQAWETDLILEARIHPDRWSQIRVVYSDPHSKRKEEGGHIGHTGPWGAVASKAVAETDPDLGDSLASRYEHTTVPHFYVYFSGFLASEANNGKLRIR